MDVKKAIKLAIEALKKERQRLAFDANTVRVIGHGSPAMKRNAQRFEELGEAMRVLEELRDGKTS